jgi:hypothetical protein
MATRNGDAMRVLIEEALAIEAQEAREAGALGYMARALVQATLPHSKPDSNEFERRNGAFTLVMLAPSRIGLPYGVVPRLLLAWMTTEAVRKRSRQLILGDSLTDFMRQLDMMPTGGRWGSITRLREQSNRLFSTAVRCIYEGEDGVGGQGFGIADRHMLWWDPKRPGQRALFESTVTLSEAFYTEVITSPVPIDLRALKALKKSPLTLDLYCWMTYRMSYLKRPTEIPWGALQVQFGSGYPDTARGQADFKKKFITALQRVQTVYGAVYGRIEAGDRLRLLPAAPHVRRRG